MEVKGWIDKRIKLGRHTITEVITYDNMFYSELEDKLMRAISHKRYGFTLDLDSGHYYFSINRGALNDVWYDEEYPPIPVILKLNKKSVVIKDI